jgi:endoglucanase
VRQGFPEEGDEIRLAETGLVAGLFKWIFMVRCIFLVWASLGFVLSHPAKKQSVNAQPTRFEIKRGTNIGHWLSQNDHRGTARSAFFTEQDVANIAALGFDHIRLPVDEMQLWDEADRRAPEAFSLLHSALAWSRKHHLRVIVDLHILRAHHFNERDQPLWREPAVQARFLECWRELSAELRRYPASWVAYELLNEPVADDPEDWNRLAGKAIEVIRQKEPGRIIVVGPNPRQSVGQFNTLRIPANDQNILLSFHYYAPFLLTHYRAGWTEIGTYEGPVHYPGPTVTEEDLAKAGPGAAAILKKYQPTRVFNAGQMEKDLLEPLQFARRHGLRLYCGEWGTLATVPAGDRLRWYRDVRNVLEKNNVAWANWDYKSTGFGFTNGQGENQQTALIRILTGE